MVSERQPKDGTIYRGYILFALFLAYAFNYIDRILLGIVQEPIKAEFGLSDFQIGLLGGPAFAVLYTFLGIPIARLAERTNRVTVITVAMMLWSGMTALCGLAASYPQLLLARLGVSVGEAGLTPPAQSILSDYFPARSRATALGLYSLGVPAGALLAAFLGGTIAETLGWRSAFILLGLPGVALAIVIRLTIVEPRRLGEAAQVPSFNAAIRLLLAKSSFRNLLVAASFSAIVTYGIGQYLTSFLVRAHGLPLRDAARLAGITIGVFAGVGTFLGGYLSDRFATRAQRSVARVPAIGLALAAPLYMAAFWSPTLGLAIGALFGGALLHYLYLAPMYAITQGVAPPRMRATSVALLLFVVNLIGYGAGPPLVGALSDWAMQAPLADAGLSANACAAAATPACAGAAAFGLRTALIAVAAVQIFAAIFFWRAGRTLGRDWIT